MAIGIYDRPAEMQLVDTYVPAPIKDLAAAAQIKEQRINENLATEDTLYSMLGDTPALSQIIGPSTGRVIQLDDAKVVKETVGDIDMR